MTIRRCSHNPERRVNQRCLSPPTRNGSRSAPSIINLSKYVFRREEERLFERKARVGLSTLNLLEVQEGLSGCVIHTVMLFNPCEPMSLSEWPFDPPHPPPYTHIHTHTHAHTLPHAHTGSPSCTRLKSARQTLEHEPNVSAKPRGEERRPC